MHGFLEAIVADFRAAKNDVNAAQMKAYMKDLFPFLGLKRPDRNLIQRNYLSKPQLPPIHELPDLLRHLWALDEREFQYLGLDILGKYNKQFEPEHIEHFEYLITNKSWWDTVDYLASNSVGSLFKKYPELKEKWLNKWIASHNMWLNRTAILFQLKYKSSTDEGLLIKSIEAHISSTEFFHRKAIGWALREYAKTNPHFTRDFVQSHPELSGLSKREALKNLN